MAITKEESARRLNVLADYLETHVKPVNFDMSKWGKSLTNWVAEVPELVPELVDCGTTACALGWACMIPEFRALGLSLRRLTYATYRYLPELNTQHFKSSVCSIKEVAVVFFGITNTQAAYLFIPPHYTLHGHSVSSFPMEMEIARIRNVALGLPICSSMKE